MAKIDAKDLSIASAAADWFLRLREGELTSEQQQRYAEWLQSSQAHRDAILFLHGLWHSLRTSGTGPTSGTPRTH